MDALKDLPVFLARLWSLREDIEGFDDLEGSKNR